MESQKPLCDLDDTWEDALPEFTAAIARETSKWSCYLLADIDSEALLSAAEVTDAKTDTGVGCGEVESLPGLLARGGIPSVADLSEEALVAVMDWILVGEMRYMQGHSIVRGYLPFPYLLAMPELKKQNTTLHSYCQGVLRTLDTMLRSVVYTNVRSDEEFVGPPPELDRQESVPLEEILAALETAAAQQEQKQKQPSPAVAARLRFRKLFLSAVSLLVESKRRSDVEAACALCGEALELLTSSAFDRADEPVLPAGLERAETEYWVTVMSPSRPLERLPYAEARDLFATMLRQLQSLNEGLLRPHVSLAGITEFIEGLAAQCPLLPTRSMVATVALKGDADRYLFGVSLRQRILEHLAKECGAPLYLRLLDGDESLLTSVVKYRVQKKVDPTKVTPAQIQFLRQQTLEMLRQWVGEACRLYMTHLESMLCNRGLAHRRLMKTVPQLSAFQELSTNVDVGVFCGEEPGTAENVEECVRASMVLTYYASSLVMRSIELIISFEVELGLLTQAELVPALWYLNFAHRAQGENLSQLCLRSTGFIPQNHVNKKTHVPVCNLALTTRRASQPDAVRATLAEAHRTLSDAIFISACVMEARGLLDLHSGPPHTLITPENVFNHRLARCLGALKNPTMVSYARCLASVPDLSTEPAKVPLYAKKAGEVAAGAADRFKALVASSSVDASRRKFLLPYVTGLERTARAVSASLNFFASLLEGDSAAEALKSFEGVVERPGLPHLLCFTLHKKK